MVDLKIKVNCERLVATFFVGAAEVVVDGFQFGAAGHDVVVELAPLAVALWVDEDDVVAAVVVAAVDQHSVQRVRGRSRLLRLQERVQVQFLVKLESIHKTQHPSASPSTIHAPFLF